MSSLRGVNFADLPTTILPVPVERKYNSLHVYRYDLIQFNRVPIALNHKPNSLVYPVLSLPQKSGKPGQLPIAFGLPFATGLVK
jgi:hypothetical protein